VTDQPGRDFFISFTAVNRPCAEWIAVRLEAADLLGRLRDGWTRLVLVARARIASISAGLVSGRVVAALMYLAGSEGAASAAVT